MPRILVHVLTVPESAIDVNGHVNNVAYIGWMQDVAIQHSAAQGWPMERYLMSGTAWVVRSHFIEYLLPAFQGDSLALLTWVAGFRQHSSKRKYLVWRPADQQVIAKAETQWVFVDAATGRPTRVPSELQTAFEVVPDEEDVLRSVHGT